MTHSRAIVVVIFAVLTGCGQDVPAVSNGLFFPAYEHDPSQPLPGATIEGTLTSSENCIYLEASGSERFLLLWPEGWAAERESGVIHIVDDSGEEVATEGQNARFGGGEKRREESAEEIYPDGTPATCRSGPVWLVSGVLS